MLSDCQNLNRLSWLPRKMMVKDLRQRSGLAWFCACADSCVVFNTGPYTVLPDNSILITANMESETSFPTRPSHQLKSYVASKSRLKLAARAVLSADAGFLVVIFGTLNPEEMSHQKITNLSTAPVKCSHCTLWKADNFISSKPVPNKNKMH